MPWGIAIKDWLDTLIDEARGDGGDGGGYSDNYYLSTISSEIVSYLYQLDDIYWYSSDIASYTSAIDRYASNIDLYASDIYDEVSNYLNYLSSLDSYASNIDWYVGDIYSELSNYPYYLSDIEWNTYPLQYWDENSRCKVNLNKKSSADNGAGSVTVGSSSTSVMSSTSNRVAATFVNDSNETIYLALASTATMNQGIRLSANGGTFRIDQTNLYRGAVSAICASGGKNLCITEL